MTDTIRTSSDSKHTKDNASSGVITFKLHTEPRTKIHFFLYITLHENNEKTQICD